METILWTNLQKQQQFDTKKGAILEPAHKAPKLHIYNTQPLYIDAFCLFSVRYFDKWCWLLYQIEMKAPDYV